MYRWDGSFWGLFKFTASNIEAETFKGFDFIGANFTSVDEFISPHHIDDNTVVEAKHKVNLKISKGAIVATDDLYFKQGDGWTSSPIPSMRFAEKAPKGLLDSQTCKLTPLDK